MNKMNKKGFTLIEMLVVIAIIAVLVSIIIPTVTSATDKAAAATNAANMRSWKAELVTSYLANGKDGFSVDWEAGGVCSATPTPAPAVKDMTTVDDLADEMTATFDAEANTFIITIGNYTIKSFADFAGGETDTVVAPTP